MSFVNDREITRIPRHEQRIYGDGTRNARNCNLRQQIMNDAVTLKLVKSLSDIDPTSGVVMLEARVTSEKSCLFSSRPEIAAVVRQLGIQNGFEVVVRKGSNNSKAYTWECRGYGKRLSDDSDDEGKCPFFISAHKQTKLNGLWKISSANLAHNHCLFQYANGDKRLLNATSNCQNDSVNIDGDNANKRKRKRVMNTTITKSFVIQSLLNENLSASELRALSLKDIQRIILMKHGVHINTTRAHDSRHEILNAVEGLESYIQKRSTGTAGSH